MFPAYKMFTSKKTKKALGTEGFLDLKIVVPVLVVEKLQVSNLATPFCTDTGGGPHLPDKVAANVCSFKN